MARFSKVLIAELKSRARDQARYLIRDHGPNAEAVLAAKMKRRKAKPEDLERYRLTAIELKTLRKSGVGTTSRALAVRKPSLFSLRGLALLFGLRKRRR